MISKGIQLRQFVSDSVLNLTRSIFGNLIALASSIIIARVLGPSGQGIYGLVIVTANMSLALGSLGIGPASLFYLGRGDYQPKEVMATNFIFWIVSCFISVSIFGSLYIFFQTTFLQGVPFHAILIGLGVVPVSIMLRNMGNIFNGTSLFKAYNIVNILPYVGLLLWSILFVWILKNGVNAALFGYLFGQVLATGVGIFFFIKYFGFPLPLKKYIRKDYLKQAVTYGLKAHVSNLLSFLGYRGDQFLVNLFLTTAEVGHYGVAASLSEKLWLISLALTTTLFPKIASFKDREDLRRELTPMIVRHLFWLSVPGGIVIALICKPMIFLFYGKAYIVSALCLQALLPGIVLLSVGRVLAEDLAARGFPGLNSFVAGISLLINLIANIYLIPKYGIIGASWASSISYGISAFIHGFLYLRISKTNIKDLIVLRNSDINRICRRFRIKSGTN